MGFWSGILIGWVVGTFVAAIVIAFLVGSHEPVMTREEWEDPDHYPRRW